LLLIDLANFNIGRGTGPMLAPPPTRGRGRSVVPLSDTLLKQYVAGAVWVFMDAGEREEVARTRVQRKVQSFGWKKGIATIKAWRGEVTSFAPSKKRAYLTIQRLWLEKVKGREPANSFVNRLLDARVQPLIERTGQGWKKGGEVQ
jgi:hypothetical protein